MSVTLTIAPATPVTQPIVDLIGAGKLGEAATVCEAVLQGAAGNLDVVNLLAIVRAQQGRLDEALRLFSGGCSEPWALGEYNFAVLLRITGNAPQALAHARRAVELMPNWAEARVLLAGLLPTEKIFGGMTTAIEEFRVAAELRPDWALPAKEWGRTLRDATRFAESEAPLRQALALEETDAETHHILAQVLIELDRLPEALVHAKRAAELRPDWPEVITAASELEAGLAAAAARAHAEPKRSAIARYPRHAAEFDDLRKIVDDYVLNDFADAPKLLSNDTRVFALGSCFADNITRALRRLGVPADHVRYPEDINSTFANRDMLEWLRDGAGPNAEIYERALGAGYRDTALAQLRSASVAIISLGVAPCFFDRETKLFVPTLGSNFSVSALLRRFDFRMTTIAENVSNLHAMFGVLRGLVPDVSIVLTVSPVPMRATFERGSAVIADCVSKSTLRMAAEEIVQQGMPGFYYWPSFEMVRWLGAHTGPVFGAEDGSAIHPTESLIDNIMAAFVRVFGDEALAARAAAAFPAHVPTPA